jgi:hypothetical protein
MEDKHISFLFIYVREITKLHPGLVAFIMNKIRGRFLKCEAIAFEDVIMYLKSGDFICHLKVNVFYNFLQFELFTSNLYVLLQGIRTTPLLQIFETNILVSNKCLDNSSFQSLTFRHY